MSTRGGVKSVRSLLRQVIDGFPEQIEKAQRILGERAELCTFPFEVQPASEIGDIPTFAKGITHKCSPMLKDRFGIAGSINLGGEIWLDVEGMRQWLRMRQLRSYHKALRNNWVNSAPAVFPDKALSLFSITTGSPQNITYLVWKGEQEPELWSYAGMESEVYNNLALFLQARLV